ncbi:MAG TPA: hypothetical protein VNV42_11235 [Solirubrobacteraceae bacterium]|nr:hypothetical protein [Solirubrobacteraceae bacterium]
MPPWRRTALLGIPAIALVVVIVALLTGGRTHPAAPSPLSSSPSLTPPSSASLTAASSTAAVLSDPIDPRFLTGLPFGTTSFWIQPWRAYLDTWPASRLTDALGINFNVEGPGQRAMAQLLHESGFTLARVEIPWDSLSYANPGAFAAPARVQARLQALHEFHLRPLIVLNANSGNPGPSTHLALTLAAPAAAGATTVTLTPASAAAVVAGRSGFDASVFRDSPHRPPLPAKLSAAARAALTPAQRRARIALLRAARRAAAAGGLTGFVLQASPGILVTKVGPGGVATLSRPLPVPLAAGTYRGSTLRYAPFAAPTLAGGAPNPAFQATLQGWLKYVGAICKLASSVVGPGGYDLEVWNELGFGSQFLNAEKYYSAGTNPSDEAGSEAASQNSPGTNQSGKTARHTGRVTNEVVRALLRATVAYVRNPAGGISRGVGISDGFASQSPFPTGADAPVGLTALSKHLYANAIQFPAGYHAKPGNVPVNALGARDTAGPLRSPGAFTPLFVPRFQSLFPEYALTATGAETVVRDIAPLTTKIYAAPHGRNVAPPGGPPLQTWMTEYNLASAGATPMGPDETAPATGPAATLTAADRAHFQAKALLRSLVAMVGKGMTREYFFAAAHVGALSLIGERFLAALKAHPESYPGAQLGGETLGGFRNLLARFAGPGPGGGARQLRLLAIAQDGDHAQFQGDGSAAHPTLYDRDVLAVFSFQSSPTRFVIPVYVMTRDLLTLYEPNQPAGDIRRFDLPEETFRITLANLPPGAPTVSAYDPLRNISTPARLVSQGGGTATFEIVATDYPRLLTLEYGR